MREILFRSKLKNTGEWLYWNVFGEICKLNGKRTKVSIAKTAGESHYYHIHQIKQFIVSETVGQYTGLTDKNGTKIFEGDIHERKNHFFVVKYGKYRDCETNEDGYGWHFEYTHRKVCEGFYGTENEYVNIIGNIHDNPELLKGGG